MHQENGTGTRQNLQAPGWLAGCWLAGWVGGLLTGWLIQLMDLVTTTKIGEDKSDEVLFI